MTQQTTQIGANKPGVTYRAEDNDGKRALLNFHKGATAPSYAEAGMTWCDDSADPTWSYKVYDGTDWIVAFTINTSTNKYTPSNAAFYDGSKNYAADTGSVNAFAISPTPTRTAHTAGEFFFVKANNTITGAATIAINGLGAVAIKKNGTAALESGDIVDDQIFLIVYDGTYYQLLSPTSAVRAFANPVRQTVVSSLVDSNGNPNYITTGSGLQPQCSGSSGDPTIMSFSAGFDANGPVDKFTQLTSNSSWPALGANTHNFLYADFVSSSTVTLGSSTEAPIYAEKFPANKRALLNFNGTNGSTSIVDEYGNTWTAFGNAQLSTGSPIFGTSSLLLDGNGDYIQTTTAWPIQNPFCIEGFFNWTTLPASGERQLIFKMDDGGSNHIIVVYLYNNAGTLKLEWYLSSSSNSDVANGTLGSKTTWATGTRYHFALSWDGATYRLFVDGVIDLSTSNGSFLKPPSRTTIGVNPEFPTSYFNGKVDSVRFTFDSPRYIGAFTAPSAAFLADCNFFDISKMKMYNGGPTTGWTAVNRVFMGEALTGAAAVSSVINYALNGLAVIPSFSLAAATAYTKNHNMGVPHELIHFQWLWRDSTSNLTSAEWRRWTDFFLDASGLGYNWFHKGNAGALLDRNKTTVNTGSTYTAINNSGAGTTGGQAMCYAKRLF